ncbi:MAG: hypothetical protein Fur0021_12440 [Candidatus Promineifilaceae bacterium]
MNRFHFSFSLLLVTLLLVGGLATTALTQDARTSPPPANSPNAVTSPIIAVPGGAPVNNGTVQLGVHREGHLNIDPPTGSGAHLGLVYLPTGNEALALGCLCEGWGVADSISSVTGWANDSWGGTFNLTSISYTNNGTTAQSTVQVGNTFEVTHDYHPSISPFLYEVTVTITNTSSSTTNLRYRRVMDWDVMPTPYSEYVTIQGAANVLYASNHGFLSPDPLSPQSHLGLVGDGIDFGPQDQGALFDFDFGLLAPGSSKTFLLYYGAADTEANALTALATVGALTYTLGQTSSDPFGGTPNTFMFAYREVPPPFSEERYSYSVKLVCGIQKNAELYRSAVGRGLYTTEINIHNFHENHDAVIEKRLLPVVLETEPIGREPHFQPVVATDAIVLPPETVTMDDCYRFSELLYGGPFPTLAAMPLTIGFMEIISPVPLVVDAVYTSSDLYQRVVNIEVEQIEGQIK